ncbi:MAG: vanadium-dependent haloperoxidase, partial [Vicinamibacterales bacterium]
VKGDTVKPTAFRSTAAGFLAGLAILVHAPVDATGTTSEGSVLTSAVLEWNQIFIDTLIAANTPNSSSQRLGAIVHTAIFDALNGIDRRYTPLFVHSRAPQDVSRRAAVVAAAYTALVSLFPSQQPSLDASYASSLAALTERCRDHGRASGRPSRCEIGIERGREWGSEVANAVLIWRATDGFSSTYPAFAGGMAIGQWRPTPPAFGPMSAQGLAFTDMFVLVSNTQFQPEPPRTLTSSVYADDFNAVKALGPRTGSTRTDDQTALAPFWEGNASVHWNQAANQIARSHDLSMSESSRLLALLNIAMADTAFTIWSAKRFYGSLPTEATWRPVTAIPLADTDNNPDTAPVADWLPLVNTPSHPEYPAGHPSLNGAAATVLLSHFGNRQTFTLTTTGQPSRTYRSIAQARADGNSARVWGGMHYPSTVAISDAVGKAIARYVNRNSMQPLHGEQD